MSTSTRGVISELAPLYPASAAVFMMAWGADSPIIYGVSAGLSIGILVLLAWWYARQPVGGQR